MRIEENRHVAKTMKALVLRRHGDLQDLEVATDYPVPQAVDGHVVIRVKASSFNYHDVFTMRGMPGIKVPLPVIVASGGVGTGCVILAKLLGAEVIACASSEDKLRRLKDMGADEAINYKTVDFSKWAVEKYGKPQRRSYEGGVDVVINFTGGDTWVPSLRCIKRGGKLLVCGATAGHDPKEDLRYVWTFEINIVGSNSFYDDDLRGLMALIQAGK